MAKFKRINYPDGQVSAIWQQQPIEDRYQTIKERINSYSDLIYVRAMADAIGKDRAGRWALFIPCLLGQRSDRRFEEGQSFDLKLICDIINACGFSEVEILDPHSDVCMALINGSKKLSSFEYVKKSVEDILSKTVGENKVLLVSPDAGAYKKVYEFGEKLNIPTMGAMKCRVDGIPAVTFTHDVEGKDCLIVDDLCDGGATFISLAKLLKLHKARSVYLYISHGLFSKGFGALHQDISHIYCTNSVKDIDTSNNHLLDAYPWIADFITQYKVI